MSGHRNDYDLLQTCTAKSSRISTDANGTLFVYRRKLRKEQEIYQRGIPALMNMIEEDLDKKTERER